MAGSFRGRIFHPEEGYTPRSLLELRIRACIGSILNKREWWIKWRQDFDPATNGDPTLRVRDKWLAEFEQSLLEQTVTSSTSKWDRSWWHEPVVLARFDGFPSTGTDVEKRAFVDRTCTTVPYDLIWNLDGCKYYFSSDEDHDDSQQDMDEEGKFHAANKRMESYGQIVWYWELVALHSRLRGVPLADWVAPTAFRLGTDEAMAWATMLLQLVRKGELTKQTFPRWCPDGDHRPIVLDALWFHVDRIMAELDSVSSFIVRTLDELIATHKLDAENVMAFISPGPVQETWMSDLLIDNDLKATFAEEVSKLENVPEEEKDWHPGSNDQVLDLVHPSLYCCVFGTTRQVPSSMDRSGCVDPVERMQRIMFGATDLVENEHRKWAKYQWIPSDFKVDVDGKVSILSYINNLHPAHHKSMYECIGVIFERFVPMFDSVLSCLRNANGPKPLLRIRNAPFYERAIDVIPWHPRIPKFLQLSATGPPFSLKGSTVQVIVKIAEIHLTPEKPSYPGGSWHVEGTDAEQIVATGIYYFGCENITESRLSFRVIVHKPEYEQYDHVGLAALFGLANEERLVQSLGSVTAVEDRCVVFPNTLQHHVDPFKLSDRSKPGVRKILAFFIVDPSNTLPSTSVIPPQQESWLRDGQEPLLNELRDLPEVVVQKSMQDLLGRGMSLDVAKVHRADLMEERMPRGVDDDDEELFFSLCEH